MIENNSTKFEQVMQTLEGKANVVASFSELSVSYNGKEGRHVIRTHILAMPKNPTDIGFYDFKGSFLKGEEGFNDWDRVGSRLYAGETIGNVTNSIIIEMHPDTVTAIASMESAK